MHFKAFKIISKKMIIVAIDENNFKKASELINKLDPKKMYGKDWECCI